MSTTSAGVRMAPEVGVARPASDDDVGLRFVGGQASVPCLPGARTSPLSARPLNTPSTDSTTQTCAGLLPILVTTIAVDEFDPIILRQDSRFPHAFILVDRETVDLRWCQARGRGSAKGVRDIDRVGAIVDMGCLPPDVYRCPSPSTPVVRLSFSLASSGGTQSGFEAGLLSEPAHPLVLELAVRLFAWRTSCSGTRRRPGHRARRRWPARDARAP